MGKQKGGGSRPTGPAKRGEKTCGVSRMMKNDGDGWNGMHHMTDGWMDWMDARTVDPAQPPTPLIQPLGRWTRPSSIDWSEDRICRGRFLNPESNNPIHHPHTGGPRRGPKGGAELDEAMLFDEVEQHHRGTQQQLLKKKQEDYIGLNGNGGEGEDSEEEGVFDLNLGGGGGGSSDESSSSEEEDGDDDDESESSDGEEGGGPGVERVGLLSDEEEGDEEDDDDEEAAARR